MPELCLQQWREEFEKIDVQYIYIFANIHMYIPQRGSWRSLKTNHLQVPKAGVETLGAEMFLDSSMIALRGGC